LCITGITDTSTKTALFRRACHCWWESDRSPKTYDEEWGQVQESISQTRIHKGPRRISLSQHSPHRGNIWGWKDHRRHSQSHQMPTANKVIITIPILFQGGCLLCRWN